MSNCEYENCNYRVAGSFTVVNTNYYRKYKFNSVKYEFPFAQNRTCFNKIAVINKIGCSIDKNLERVK